MITQDFVKGIDVSGLTEVTATQLNQLVDVARPGADKGLVLHTTDTALDTPDVPDPNTAISGVTPTWWKRYIWNRTLYDGAGAYAYLWDDGGTSDATYLKWVRVDALSADAAADATAALALATAADAAVTTLTGDLSAFEDRLDVAEANILTNSSNITSQGVRITALETGDRFWHTGDIRTSFADESYSTSSDEGWLECNGAQVSKSIFAALAAALGSRFGETESLFTLPDCRGRTIIGAGTGSGLTSRTFGGTGGEETVTLTAANIQHKHYFGNTYSDTTQAWLSYTASPTAVDSYPVLKIKSNDGSSTTNAVQADLVTLAAHEAGSMSAHSNMQPWIAAKVFIKT